MQFPKLWPGTAADVTAYGGMCTSSDPRATAAGVQMLMCGGNAVDAAVATAFALAVHEPAMSHLGGQGNMLVHLAESQETVALDFYACAPGAADPGMYAWTPGPTQGGYRFQTRDDLNTTGALAVAIPGNVCGWVTAQRRWGALELSEVVAPAVHGARTGSPATARIAAFIAETRDRLARFPETAATFLHSDGMPRREGELLLQPHLADTIESIGEQGYEPFYRGTVAKAIVEHISGSGGILSEQDLARYPEELMWTREPDWVDYKGHRIAGATPSSSALLMNLLAILDGLNLGGGSPLAPGRLHLLIESMKLAFAERSLHIGDHTQVNVPLAGLTSPEYARLRRALIDHAKPSFPEPGDPWAYQDERPHPDLLTSTAPTTPAPVVGTTHHSHVDRHGNFVSMSQSLGDGFGSCVTVPGHGIILNNAMKLFDPRPGPRPAGISPYRRPMGPWPTLVLQDGRAVMALGSPSGTRIPNAVAQVLSNVLEQGMGLQDAVDLPRLHWSGDELEAESDLPEDTKAGLAAIGHEVEYRSARSPWFGAVQVVARDPESGLCLGAADVRRTGAAAGVTFPALRPTTSAPAATSTKGTAHREEDRRCGADRAGAHDGLGLHG
ncbi:gamma-glutamyltransferase [Pseudonocardia nigra]|uniref:gamma-glutamyltransferase n=1 Tax=Pseudonocardia nigra TaxID=1921578 RepID=UPI001C606399|nr:gamma-glutamyltransferase [Pseudonocardia nigra]